MNILEKITDSKKSEIIKRHKSLPISRLKESPHFSSVTRSLSASMKHSDQPAIIAEFKRKSPSKGVLHDHANVLKIIKGYEMAGASAISVLTDQEFFGARQDDFALARSQTNLPLLRKDFIISEYQVYETKAMGADIILLIGAVLPTKQIQEFSALARELGLDVLYEIHDESELGSINSDIKLVGINNRNLKTFQVDLAHTLQLKSLLPEELQVIAESGLSSPNEVTSLFRNGIKGFLIGESFMRSSDPPLACSQFIEEITKHF